MTKGHETSRKLLTYEVEIRYPYTRVHPYPDAAMMIWKFRKVQFTVRAYSPRRAAGLVIDHMASVWPQHAASFRLLVTHIDESRTAGIKFSVNGCEGRRFVVRKSPGGEPVPFEIES